MTNNLFIYDTTWSRREKCTMRYFFSEEPVMGSKKEQQACYCFLIGKKNLKYSTHTYEHILQKIAFSQGPTYHRVCYVYDKHNVQYPKSKQT